MYQEDYIRRMLGLLNAAIVRVLRSLGDGDTLRARQEIEEAYAEIYGLSPDLILLMPSEEVIGLINRLDGADADLVLGLAELICLDARVSFEARQTEDGLSRVQAAMGLVVAAFAEQDPQEYAEPLVNFEPQVQLLIAHGAPPDLLAGLYLLYREIGRYAVGLDLILAFLGTSPAALRDGLGEAQAILTEIQALPDAARARAGLTTEQIEGARRRLQVFAKS